MKSFLLAALLLLASFAPAQTYYAIWEDQPNQIYYFVSVDPTTGIKTNISPLSGVTGYIAPGTACINTNTDEFVVRLFTNTGNRLYAIDLTTGQPNSNVAMNDNVVGLEYNCNTGSVYGIWEDANQLYHLMELDVANGTHTSVTTIPNMTGYVGGTFSIDVVDNTYNFFGWTGAGQVLFSININSGSVNSNVQPQNVHALEFNCSTDSLIGRWEDQQNSTYYLMHINPATGATNQITAIANTLSGNIADAHTLDPDTGWYCYLGYDAGNNINLFTLDATTGAVLYNFPVTYTNLTALEAPACCTQPVVAPMAAISSTYTDTICTGETVTFQDVSTNSPTAWSWNLPGASPSSDSTSVVSVMYNTPGTYTASLTVSNSAGTDSTTWATNIVVVSCNAPVASYSSTYTGPICAGDTIEFTGTTPNATSFDWTFAGATPAVANGPNQSVVYPNAGLFDVTLIVANANGVDTLYQQAEIEVNDCTGNPPVASFTWMHNGVINPDTVCELDTVTFTSTSTGNPTQFAWSFTGATPTTGTGSSFATTFNALNGQIIELIVTNADGSDTAMAPLVVVPCPNSVHEQSERVLRVWPNPFDERLSIELPQGLQGSVQLQLFDMSGRLVQQTGKQASPRVSWQLSALAAGSYMLEVSTNQHTHRQLVIARP